MNAHYHAELTEYQDAIQVYVDEPLTAHTVTEVNSSEAKLSIFDLFSLVATQP